MIATIVLIWAIYYIVTRKPYLMNSRQPQRFSQAEISQNQTTTEKAKKKAEKEFLKAEKARQQKEQAEADKLFIIHLLDETSDLLNVADTELKQITKQIQIDQALKSIDSLKKHQKKKEMIQKKVLSYESKIHALESKLAKVNYILAS